MTIAAITALVIFVVMFGVITWGKIHRFIPALIGGAVVLILVFLVIEKNPQLILNTLNVGQLIQGKFWFPGHEPLESRGVNWQTIIFIAGMMIMVEGLAKVGFFRWMCLLVAKLVHYKTLPILVTFTILAGFLSMFIDSITVMLFLAVVTIELARLLKFDPVPVIIAEIFASNTGGAATMSGDPPNIIIGTALGLTFMDFVKNTGVIAWAGMVLVVIFFYLASRKTLSPSHKGPGLAMAAGTAGDIPVNTTDSPSGDAAIELSGGGTAYFPVDASDNRAAGKVSSKPAQHYPSPGEAVNDYKSFLANVGIFVLAIALLVTHAQTGISVALIGVIAAALTLVVNVKDFSHIMKRIDWRTLVFFIGLFICVGGLEETGVLTLLATYIGNISGGSLLIAMTIILWLSAFASAVVDNIPFAATMVPVISGLSQSTGIPIASLAWPLALGTDIGGNATPIGASANVVGTAIAEREGYPIGWGRFLKFGVPSMIMVVGLCWLMLFLRYV